MSIMKAALLLFVAVGYVQGQTPVGYTKIADQDFIDAGPLTTLRQDISTLQACADACSQDAQCQSFRMASFCTLYRLRRCMTPPVHNSPFAIELGEIYEKNSPVVIPEGSQIITVCADYTSPVISSVLESAPNGPNVNADRAAFNAKCSQLCSAQTSPKCRSWKTLYSFENNPQTPVDLLCTVYADSIYDVDNSHGFLSMQEDCKRAQSVIAINGPATSFLRCSRASA